MRAEIKRTVKFNRETVVSYNKQYVRRPEISKVLRHISENGTSSVDKRLIDQFIKLGLLEKGSGSLTTDGENAVANELVSMPEYGQYDIVTISDDPWFPSSILALKRDFAGKEQDEANSQDKWVSQRISYPAQKNIWDSDMKKYADLGYVKIQSCRQEIGKKPLSFECTINYDSSAKETFCDIKGLISWGEGGSTPLSIQRQVDLNFDDLFEDIIPGYDPIKKALRKDSVPDDDQEIRNMVTTMKNCTGEKDGYEYRYDVSDLPLVASDKGCAEEWMSRLRRIEWKDAFVSAKQCHEDQKEWKESLYPSGRFKLPEGEDLLDDVLDDRRVYWNIASMLDLVPEGSEMRCEFYINADEEITKKMKEYIFTDRVADSFEKISVVDNYAAPNLLEVLHHLLPGCTDVFLFSDSEKYRPKQDKIDPKNLPHRIHHTELKGEHDRYLIIKHNDGRTEYWSVTNSFDKYRIRDGGLYSTKKIRFSPALNIDNDLRKAVEGNK
ncbi:MAG: hypothetical protein FWH44_00500 [Methanomassiliicoccaceae archaeon]|nr:hypothetical protein [Methanomassiliicoccaceae archaeon]